MIHHHIRFWPTSRLGWRSTSRLESFQHWEVPGPSTSGVPVRKRCQEAYWLHGWDFKDCSSGLLFTIPGQLQTDIINLWPNCSSAFMLMLFILSCKTWSVAKSGACLPRPPPGAHQPQDSFPILSMVLEVLHSQQAVTHSQLTVRAGWSKVRGLFCFVSEAWTRLFI